ncbi:hypothetical protein M885DRAFT_520347 [Pelagophyceae sp. CCMP2097]|nr:hypothetical protein M885DRAFT_520347 [Pelagophyceae sp. CCMP2097]
MDDAALRPKKKKLVSAIHQVIEQKRISAKAKQVRVGYKINGIRDLNSINCTFTIDFKVFYYWDEPSVVGMPQGFALDPLGPQLFQPELVISNEADLTLSHWEFQVKDPKLGLVKLSQYYRGKLLIPNMSLVHFPFDVQNLRICIKPHKKSINELELVPATSENAVEHHARHEWRVIGSCTACYATNPAHSTTGKVYSALHIVVLVERESHWHVRTIMLPICSIAVLSLSVYAFRVDDVAGRSETAVALVLTNIAMKLTIADYMPKLPYRTLCDVYLDVCFLCQIIICVSNSVIFLLHRAAPNLRVRLGLLGRWHVTEVLNMVFFVLMTAALCKLNTYTYGQLREHLADVEEWRKQALPASGPAPDGIEGRDGIKLRANNVQTAAGAFHEMTLGRLTRTFTRSSSVVYVGSPPASSTRFSALTRLPSLNRFASSTNTPRRVTTPATPANLRKRTTPFFGDAGDYFIDVGTASPWIGAQEDEKAGELVELVELGGGLVEAEPLCAAAAAEDAQLPRRRVPHDASIRGSAQTRRDSRDRAASAPQPPPSAPATATPTTPVATPQSIAAQSIATPLFDDDDNSFRSDATDRGQGSYFCA